MKRLTVIFSATILIVAVVALVGCNGKVGFTLTADPNPITGGSSSTIEAKITYKGKPIPAGHSVTFEVTKGFLNGNFGGKATVVGKTDAKGVARASLNGAIRDKSGTVTVEATVKWKGKSRSRTVTVTVNVP